MCLDFSRLIFELAFRPSTGHTACCHLRMWIHLHNHQLNWNCQGQKRVWLLLWARYFEFYGNWKSIPFKYFSLSWWKKSRNRTGNATLSLCIRNIWALCTIFTKQTKRFSRTIVIDSDTIQTLGLWIFKQYPDWLFRKDRLFGRGKRSCEKDKGKKTVNHGTYGKKDKKEACLHLWC